MVISNETLELFVQGTNFTIGQEEMDPTSKDDLNALICGFGCVCK